MFRVSMYRNSLLVLALAGLLAACGGEAVTDSPTPGVLDTGAGDAGADLAPILQTPCIDNTDCEGGQICRDGLCREACGEQDPCEGALPVCDLERGYCVECLGDIDCAPDQTCSDDLCVFWCSDDEACPEGSHCDESTGQCADIECSGDTDCAGGFQCVDHACVAIDDIICEPDSLECDENTLVTCSGDGTATERFDCGERLCVENDGVARCADAVCDPDSIGCVDVETAFLCDSTGAALTELPCRDGRYCDVGVCWRQVCEPDTVSCEGDVVVTCDDLGASVTTTACASLGSCELSESGCTCLDGACEQRICRPGSARCVGDSTQACAEHGLSYGAPVTCGEDSVCVAGGCLPRACEPGSSLCSADVLVTCAEDGTGRTETDCSEGARFCFSDELGAECRARVCEPDAVGCDESGAAVVTCDSRGSEESIEACDEEDVCRGGACFAAVDPLLPEADLYLTLPNGGASRSGEVSVETTFDRGDVVFNLDVTGSMGGAIASLTLSLETQIIPLLSALVSDVAVGISRFADFPCDDHGHPDDEPFVLEQRVTTDPAAAQSSVAAIVLQNGGDLRESGVEALYQVATGAGRSPACDGDSGIPAFDPDEGLLPGVASGEGGGVGFRDDAVSVAIHITDASSHARGEHGYPYGATRSEAHDALVATEIAVIGLAIGASEPFGGFSSDATDDLTELAYESGALVPPCAWHGYPSAGEECTETQCCTGVDGAGVEPDDDGLCPLVFDVATSAFPGASIGVPAGVVSGVFALLSARRFDVTAVLRRDESEHAASGIDTTCFIEAVAPSSSESRGCGGAVPADTDADDVLDGFSDVSPGATLNFAVHARNDCVEPADETRTFLVYVDLVADDGTALGSEVIAVSVPAATGG